MRLLYLIITILLSLNSDILFSQNVQWVKKGISPGFETGNAIACDDSGNVYAAGQIEYTSVFDNRTVSSYGSHDILVVKYDRNGVIKWIHSAGGRGGDVANGMSIDASHNTYIAGEVEDTVNFGSGVFLISSGANDIFLAKYNIGGNIVWAKRWGNTGNDKALSVAVAENGDCFITGYFSETISIGSTQISSSGGRDIFIAKINSSGTVQWAKKAGGNGEDKGLSVSLDKTGNIYVAGSFTQSASFSGNTITNSGKNSAFLAKYNSNGSIQWAKAAGACCDTTQYRSVFVDENSNVYVAGSFKGDANFGSNHFTSSGNSDIVIAKYNTNGNLQWAKHAGGIAEDIAYGINVDTVNHIVYVTGNVNAAGSFDFFQYTISGFKDIFVVAYDYSGNVLWDKINGGSRRDIGSAITSDRQGYIYTTGVFNGTAFFDSYSITGYPDQPWADFYADKISAYPATPPTTQSSNIIITQGVCTDLNISFTPGNGRARLIVAHKFSDVNAYPVNGTIYNANSVFGNGTDLGNGNFIVYNGTGNNLTISGLAPGTTYYFAVIEYNGTGASNSYQNNLALRSNATTANYSISISGIINSICLGDSLSLQANGATNYSWSPSAGLSATTGAYVIAKPQESTNYTLTGDVSGCRITLNFSITVNPIPDVHFSNLNAVCANDFAFPLTGGTPIGGTYNGPGVRGGQFEPTSTGAGSFTLLYIYTNSFGCSNISSSNINVKSLPEVSLSPLNALCINDAPVILNGIPSGGIYSGNGVSSGFFDPSIGTGAYVISYSVLGNNGCSNTANENVIVNSLPIINLGADTMVCSSSSILINAGTGYSTYLWSDGSTTTSIIVDSSGIGLGIKTVYVKVRSFEGCFNSDTMNVRFDLCSGINDDNILNFATIFPNPSENILFVTSKTNEKIKLVNVYNTIGQRLAINYSSKLNGELLTVNTSLLSSGIYFLEVFTEKKKMVTMFVKE